MVGNRHCGHCAGGHLDRMIPRAFLSDYGAYIAITAGSNGLGCYLQQ